MKNLVRDLRFSLRNFSRKPVFVAVVLLSLALGIGSNTAIYTLLDAVFFHPFAAERPEELAAMHITLRDDSGQYRGQYGYSNAVYRALREQNRSFSDLVLYQWAGMNFTGGEEPERGTGMFTSANYLDILGLRPALGRYFLPEEDAIPGSHLVTVLAHSYWQRRFGSDPEVLGRTVTVNGHDLTVVGVGPEGFKGTLLEATVDLWVPSMLFPVLSPYGHYFAESEASLFRVFGRLRSGLTLEQAERQLTVLMPEATDGLITEAPDLGARLEPLYASTLQQPGERGRFAGYGKVLAVAVLMVLSIACLNVASLLLAHGRERARELAVRRAVGAGRGRLIRQLLTETVFLFLAGGLLAVPVAMWTLSFLWSLRPAQFPEDALDLSLDPKMFLFALGLALATGLLCGLVPAIRASAPDLVSSLKQATGSDVERTYLGPLHPHSLLVIGQVALALVALLSAGLFARSLENAQNLELGFDAERLLTLSFAPGEQGYDEEWTNAFYRRVVEEVERVPGVEAATLTENRLLRGAVEQRPVYLPGDDLMREIGSRSVHRINTVVPGFFETVGIPFVEGRDFDSGIQADGAPVVVINRAMAESLWPGESPIGRTFHLDAPSTPPVQVIGVVENAKYRRIHEPEQFFLYRPAAQNHAKAMSLHVRCEAPPGPLVAEVRERVRSLAPGLVLRDVGTLSSFVESALWAERMSATLLGVFSLLAMSLAILGVYGVVTYSLTMRYRELSIRMALGAQKASVFRAVLLDSAKVVALGLALGWVLAWFLGWRLALTPSLESQLHGARANDPASFAGVSLLLAAIAFVSCLPPLLKAVRTNPMSLLRSE